MYKNYNLNGMKWKWNKNKSNKIFSSSSGFFSALILLNDDDDLGFLKIKKIYSLQNKNNKT